MLNEFFSGGSGAPAGYTIERSLRFNSADSAYLDRTPSSAGNRKTWTWAGWVKRSAFANYQNIFGAEQDTNNRLRIEFSNTDTLIVGAKTGGSDTIVVTTSQVFRDSSAWYHIVFAIDTTQATSTDRVKLYVNGIQVTSFSSTTYPSLNYDTFVNATVAHGIGAYGIPATYFNGYLADVHFIDGHALDPASFGEFDDNGVWQPKEYLTSSTLSTINSTSGDTQITLTSNTNFSDLGVGKEVRQDSGYTPQTSAITNVQPIQNTYGPLLWSSAVVLEGSFLSTAYDTTEIFDGSSGTYAVPSSGGTVRFRLLNPLETDGLEIKLRDLFQRDGTDYFSINDSGWLNAADYPGTGGYTVITDILRTTSNPSQLEEIGLKRTGGVGGAISQVLIDGQVIRDNQAYDTSVVELTLTDDTDLENFRVGDVESTGNTVTAIGPGNTMTVVGGTWSNGDTVTGPTLAAGSGIITAFDSGANTIDYTLISGRFISGEGKSASVLGPYGTNGFHLPFGDNSTAAALGTDAAGSNDWTVNNISVTAGAGNDSLFDSPTNGTQEDTGAGGEVSGNYATYNPLYNNAVGGGNGAILSDGNLKTTFTTSGSTGTVPATIFVSSGKWYCEFTAENISGGAEPQVGIIRPDDAIDGYIGKTGTNGVGYEPYQDRRYNAGTPTSSMFGQTTTSGTHIYGLALDLDVGTLDVYEDGTLLGELVSGLSGTWAFAVADIGEADVPTIIANFGQRPFAYAAPSGFKALCTTNLDDPTIADVSTAMDVVTYTGNGTSQTISGLSFSPDFVWIKNRSQVDPHGLFDTIRGATRRLITNGTSSENISSQSLTAFTSDGFSVGGLDAVNASSLALVAWAWDAGTSTVSNTDGSITSSVRANPSAGFSIVSYTGTSANATVGHGLNAAPEFIIIKNRDRAVDWIVYHSAIGATKGLKLNTTGAPLTVASYFNNTAPTSSVVSLGAAGDTNYTGEDIIAYCFAPVEGYSAFGSYTGNGDADGPFVYTGFKPAFVMYKRTDSTSDWNIDDYKRDGYNFSNKNLRANLNNAEGGASFADFLSNGFKLRQVGSSRNASGGTYIYAAFAENPFKTARAR